MKIPMYALDKTEVKLAINNSTLARYEARAKKIGIKRATLINAMLDELVAKDPYTIDIKNRVDELYQINLKKREALKRKMAK